MYQNSLAQKLEGMLGYIAWSVVCYLTLSAHPTDTQEGILRLISIVVGLLLFIVCFYLTTRDNPYNKTRVHIFNQYDNRIRKLGYFGQLITMLFLRTLNDPGVAANTLLTIAIAAQTPICFSRLTSIFIVLGLILLDTCLNLLSGYEDAMLIAAVSGAFQLVAFRMAQRVIQEIIAREHISTLNRELVATQELLEQSTKQSERLRISRDLHDGLGHNLTALILKLQYLTYICKEDDCKESAVEAHMLAKHLLQDVRESVSQMRESAALHLKDALDALITQVPSLNISLQYSDDVLIGNSKAAETLFRCVQEAITNTLKHSNATKMDIRVYQNSDGITVEVFDNGRIKTEIAEGNGLKGMRERIESLGGSVEFFINNGFNMNLFVPATGVIA
ncbi:signal transduction histidine kinase [Reinekea marinisedimentorum]|uniref:Signal transduction histidine kinase n=2 Tax=Reinekea marinisedimentorum TaxID=230495 RepID=A0A4R3I8E5_9GAMM|nr:signal transduction histidine kinase [Reinekea marinisedimentorum]